MNREKDKKMDRKTKRRRQRKRIKNGRRKINSIEILITGKEKAFYLFRICLNTVKQNCATCTCKRFAPLKMHQLQCRIGHGPKSSKRKAVCAGQEGLDDHQDQKRWLSWFQKCFCEALGNT